MIDREIQDALKVDPSPEFAARVRTRIASEPAPSSWRWSWMVAAAGACAAAIVAAVVVSRPPAATVVVVAPSRAATEGTTPQHAPVAQQQASVAPVVPPTVAELKPRVIDAAEVRPNRIATEPELLLDPTETRALQGLIAGVRDGRIDLAAAANASAATVMELAPVTDIVIPPITIDPLTPSGDQGARQ